MGNKRKHKSSIHSNSDLTKEEENDSNNSPIKNVKRSVSFSGQRGTNPFSIVPDNYSDKNDSDDNSDKDNLDELDSISQFTGGVSIRRLSSGWQSSPPTDYGNSTDFNNTSEVNGFSNQNQSEVGQSSSKKQKKKGKKQEKALQMYDERYETTQLPSKDDVNEIIGHLKQASQKSWEVFLRVIQWIAVKSLALIVLIIQVVLLIIKYIWIVISTVFYHILKGIFSVFPFLNSILLKKHDKKDPFKRSSNNANMKRINDMANRDEVFRYDSNLLVGKKKRFTLALDLDETLVYTQPYNQKQKEKVDIQNSPDMFQVIHPTQQQIQIFTFKKRPGLDIFLLEMSKFYNLVIYSSAQKQYVDAIVDKIDTNRLIVKRFYRDDCMKCLGFYIKDLQNAGDITQTIILDNSQDAVKLDSANSLIISSFRGQENDQELQLFSKILSFIAENSIKKNISISESLHYFKDNFW